MKNIKIKSEFIGIETIDGLLYKDGRIVGFKNKKIHLKKANRNKKTNKCNTATTTYIKGEPIEAVNGSFLHHPLIQERLNYFNYNKPLGFTNNFIIKNNEIKKYFKEMAGITYASGISIKKYKEE